MNAVSGGGDGDVEAGVDEQLCAGIANIFEDAAGERGQNGGWKVLFAELDVVDAFGRPAGGLLECGAEGGTRTPTIRLRNGFVREEGPVGDGVAAHGVSVWDFWF